ncbi:YjdF family protein [Cohnella xylanilytica]|uniref:YjdF family protein n=1 Tax=Cohnella xylanilytica TaxID=557555 RepID=A0A841U444_9BACL|nr:YjdF family protein [Cohnella xylanilytica]MBB6694302.1 YjdF family protein [Cohnella xylanilytica]
MKLTVYHDGQYWVGVAERSEGSKIKACRHIFGSEPADGEVMEFVQRRLLPLLEGTRHGVEGRAPDPKRVNPKRLAREVARVTRARGVSAYAQEAMKLELEERKKERQLLSRQRRDELREAKRQLKVKQAKEKRRGR